ncbi:MAG: hypothetical protein QGG50_06615 [Methanopyri archaeon]|nr:hypothetical protein [Methanopyri archaeon]
MVRTPGRTGALADLEHPFRPAGVDFALALGSTSDALAPPVLPCPDIPEPSDARVVAARRQDVRTCLTKDATDGEGRLAHGPWPHAVAHAARQCGDDYLVATGDSANAAVEFKETFQYTGVPVTARPGRTPRAAAATRRVWLVMVPFDSTMNPAIAPRVGAAVPDLVRRIAAVEPDLTNPCMALRLSGRARPTTDTYKGSLDDPRNAFLKINGVPVSLPSSHVPVAGLERVTMDGAVASTPDVRPCWSVGRPADVTNYLDVGVDTNTAEVCERPPWGSVAAAPVYVTGPRQTADERRTRLHNAVLERHGRWPAAVYQAWVDAATGGRCATSVARAVVTATTADADAAASLHVGIGDPAIRRHDMRFRARAIAVASETLLRRTSRRVDNIDPGFTLAEHEARDALFRRHVTTATATATATGGGGPHSIVVSLSDTDTTPCIGLRCRHIGRPFTLSSVLVTEDTVCPTFNHTGCRMPVSDGSAVVDDVLVAIAHALAAKPTTGGDGYHVLTLEDVLRVAATTPAHTGDGATVEITVADSVLRWRLVDVEEVVKASTAHAEALYRSAGPSTASALARAAHTPDRARIAGESVMRHALNVSLARIARRYEAFKASWARTVHGFHSRHIDGMYVRAMARDAAAMDAGDVVGMLRAREAVDTAHREWRRMMSITIGWLHQRLQLQVSAELVGQARTAGNVFVRYRMYNAKGKRSYAASFLEWTPPERDSPLRVELDRAVNALRVAERAAAFCLWKAHAKAISTPSFELMHRLALLESRPAADGATFRDMPRCGTPSEVLPTWATVPMVPMRRRQSPASPWTSVSWPGSRWSPPSCTASTYSSSILTSSPGSRRPDSALSPSTVTNSWETIPRAPLTT